jgi:mRNA-degrading endonuclease RelE of RelBE toxin-antitoxin system/PHD/YefM family antitoxin component YafN of YafNO toxin-antitoxin module
VKRLEILEQPDDVRALVRECELTGKQTLFERDGRPVAALISYDEYMALRETIDIFNDPDLRTQIGHSVDEAKQGAILATEDLFDRRLENDRLRISESAERDWNGLADHEREATRTALVLLDEDPIAGAPLFEPLRGIWSHRIGHLRIVYQIMPEARFVLILAIARVAA